MALTSQSSLKYAQTVKLNFANSALRKLVTKKTFPTMSLDKKLDKERMPKFAKLLKTLTKTTLPSKYTKKDACWNQTVEEI
jgi:tRNA A-37 threonylcarbamoyl transferase component Bud32